MQVPTLKNKKKYLAHFLLFVFVDYVHNRMAFSNVTKCAIAEDFKWEVLALKQIYSCPFLIAYIKLSEIKIKLNQMCILRIHPYVT